MAESIRFINVALEADTLVNGDRAKAYGSWEENFRCAADIAYAVYGIKLTPLQIVQVMDSVKMARDKHRKKRDNLVDRIGYMLGMEELESAYERKDGVGGDSTKG